MSASKACKHALVKELALRRITTIETANRVLEGGFITELNGKFSQPSLSPEAYHRPVPQNLDLVDVFCFEELRHVQNDWTIRYENRYYQILDTNRPLPKAKRKVLVRRRLDGTRHLLYRDGPLDYRPMPLGELRKRAAAALPRPQEKPDRPTPTPRKPAPDHPWRKAALPRAVDRTRL